MVFSPKSRNSHHLRLTVGWMRRAGPHCCSVAGALFLAMTPLGGRGAGCMHATQCNMDIRDSDRFREVRCHSATQPASACHLSGTADASSGRRPCASDTKDAQAKTGKPLPAGAGGTNEMYEVSGRGGGK